jgi:hypothetical protein
MSPIHPITATDVVAGHRRTLMAEMWRVRSVSAAARPERRRSRRVWGFGRTRLAPC